MPGRHACLLIAFLGLTLAGPGAAQVGSSVDPITAAEVALSAQGYDPGPPNGVWGKKSTAALMAYQQDWGLPVTGELNDDLVARLKREHAATRPQWFPMQGSSCTAWNEAPQPQETATWTGSCAGGWIEGQGTLVWRSMQNGRWLEQRHEGSFSGGRASGYGVATYADGGRYEGTFREGKRHGQGVRTWPDGSTYEGSWNDDDADGSGTLRLSDGRVFSGTWHDGCFRQGTEWATVEKNVAQCGF